MPSTYRINWLVKNGCAQRALATETGFEKNKGSKDVTAVCFGRLCVLSVICNNLVPGAEEEGR